MNFLFDEVSAKFYTNEVIERIKTYHIGIAGCGGLGSNCASLLVRAGFENFTLIDFDTVEVTNLNRQFFFYNQIGLTKVQALADNILQINPNLTLTTIHTKITLDNITQLFGECSIIVEAVDNARCKAVIIEGLYKKCRLLVSASGMAGIGDSDSIQTRTLGNTLHIVGDMQSDIDEGLLPYAPRVTITAAKQADIILDYVVNNKKDSLL